MTNMTDMSNTQPFYIRHIVTKLDILFVILIDIFCISVKALHTAAGCQKGPLILSWQQLRLSGDRLKMCCCWDRPGAGLLPCWMGKIQTVVVVVVGLRFLGLPFSLRTQAGTGLLWVWAAGTVQELDLEGK